MDDVEQNIVICQWQADQLFAKAIKAEENNWSARHWQITIFNAITEFSNNNYSRLPLSQVSVRDSGVFEIAGVWDSRGLLYYVLSFDHWVCFSQLFMGSGKCAALLK